MKRIRTGFFIILISILMAGVYGILHDQITYSISTEYYTKFKFPQFRIGHYAGKAPEVIVPNPRLSVAVVGFLATWWVGLLIGCILCVTGLFIKDSTQQFKITFHAILLNITVVFIFGIIGYILGAYIFDHSYNFWVPEHVSDTDHFSIVGWIHNFGYLGGVIGLLAAVRYTIKKGRITR